jgi:hypothetical protein
MMHGAIVAALESYPTDIAERRVLSPALEQLARASNERSRAERAIAGHLRIYRK